MSGIFPDIEIARNYDRLIEGIDEQVKQIESKDKEIKILREALGLVLANTDTAIITRVLLNRALAEIDKMKGV